MADTRDVRDVVQSYGHAAGSCRMGVDALSVVDPHLRVHGLAGLRVADASIMPEIVSANTNAATVMIGEKAADLLRGRDRAEDQGIDSARRPRPIAGPEEHAGPGS